MIHRLRTQAVVAAALALLTACADEPTRSAAAPDETLAPVLNVGPRAEVAPNRYVVVLKDDVADAPGLARRLAAAHGGTLHHTYERTIKGFGATLPEPAVEALRRDQRVEFIQPDLVYRPQATQYSPPNWGLDRIDQRALPLDQGYTYGTTGDSVNVYVFDTGIQTGLAEFEGRASVGFDGFYDSYRYTGQDCNGHGTHVAGIIGSKSYGVAKRARLISVRVLNCGRTYGRMETSATPEGYTSTVMAGVEWLDANRVRPAVANMSLGTAHGTTDPALERVVRASIASSGVAYVVAAGNENVDACRVSPARVAEAITVGSIASNDSRASNSNWGACLDVFAPGDGITSTWPTGTNIMSGTSMAAPHVTGAVARLLQNDRTATPGQVHGYIVTNATPNVVGSAGTGSPNLLLFAPYGVRIRP